jgi:hypothetical protein
MDFLRFARTLHILLAFSFPAVLIHLSIRLIMGPLFPEIQSPSLALLLERYFTRIGAYTSLFATFGAIWVVLPFAFIYIIRQKRMLKEIYLLPIFAFIIFLVMGTIASDHDRYLFFISFPFLIPMLALYFSRYNSKFNKPVLYSVIAIFFITRLLLSYRPELQEGFAPTGRQSETVIILISISALIQILVMLYYIVVAHSKGHIPGTVVTDYNEKAKT